MYNYDGLNKLLKQQEMKKSDLLKHINISSRTIAKINRGEKIQNSVLIKISKFFNCEISDIYREESDNIILQKLRDEKVL